jgi:dTDP-4-amino-4,6-dideoxygalactose transaminase
MKPRLPQFSEVENLLRRIDASHIYSNRGPLLQELEIEYANYLGARPELVVAVANATLALQGLVEGSEVDDWYVPDYTFSATGLAVLKANKRLNLLDVELQTWKLDNSLVQNNSSEIGLIPVMPFGAEVDLMKYKGFEKVIIDAAASMGRVPPDLSKMNSNWSIVFSLHATKVLGAGEGSIVICGNEKMASDLRAWINFGFLAGSRASGISGTNAKMSEFNAAYGLASIRKIESERTSWLEPQQMVSDYSQGRPWCTLVNIAPSFQPYWIANFETEKKRNYVEMALADSGIQSRCWWTQPLSKQSAFKLNSKVVGSVVNADVLASGHLGLPMYPGLNGQDVKLIVDTIDECLAKFRDSH